MAIGSAVALLAGARAADKGAPAAPAEEFGKDVQLAPFVVKGQKLSIAIHARTNGDRRYATELAEEVVGIAYETMEKSTGAGLVIVGREGEPHPVVVIRKFLAMAEAGRLDPVIAAHADAIKAKMADWKQMVRIDEEDDDPDEDFKITFDMIMPALPLPLEGATSKLYQLSWAEGFDDQRVEQKLRALTAADWESDALAKKYDWVFYLPPRNAYIAVQNDLMAQVMKKEKMGLLKRAAIKTALLAFKPAIKKAVEGFRKGVLYLSVLRARSGYNRGDITALTEAYTNTLMPDFKFTSGSERERALAAIRKQQAANAEYAKDPYVTPARLTAFDPATYAPFEGAYGTIPVAKDGKPGKPSRLLARKDAAWIWDPRSKKPPLFYPAGERLLVSADGKMTIEFKVDDHGAITGAEERRERYRHTYPWPAKEVKRK